MLLIESRALLDAFRAGAPDALRSVYAHYLPRVHGQLRAGFSFSSGGRAMRFNGYRDAFDRDNAAQEVFARAFAPRARLAYDGVRPYGDYLMAITRNLVLNELRRKELLFVEESSGGDAPCSPPDELLEEREVERLLVEFAAGLAQRDGEYFRVRFTEARSQVEAAEVMDMNRIVARRMEARIKVALLEYMKARGYLSRVPDSVVGSLSPVKP